MPIVSNPTAQITNGAVATNALLSAISVATVTENSVVQTLGGTAPGDGNAGLFYFAAASTRAIDNVNVLGTPTTGRWIGVAGAFSTSGVGPLTASLTGYAETFVLFSGFAPIVYTLPPSVNVIGERITLKTLTTGTVTLRAGNATDTLYGAGPTNASVPVTSFTSTLTGGYAWNFIAQSGAYFRVDTPASVA